ncbi:MAG: glucosamine-6-phosphate deaminase [Xanthomonadales bacterium]|nr:glucosamine-6-phosphate deaminase [Gammaproteobacteria bacterium]NNK05218.1 glucosamine-6-phosphate deaminase [Xanthomonadales bacterium]
MEIIILKSAASVAAMGAELVQELIRVRPAAVLGLATGSTQLSLYQELVERYLNGEISFRQATSFNLDEYLGVAADDPQSYRAYMDREFFDRVDIDKRQTFLPVCEQGKNPVRVGPRYERKIREAGGIDLQILGIGANGHIGFNEPSSSLGSRTRIKTLTRQTCEDNSRFFKGDEFQPVLAITMGIATIMEARKILLLATGANKAGAVSEMIEGPVTAMCPASVLQMHEHVTVLLDEAAASGLQNRDYYDWTRLQNESLQDRFGVFHDE